MPVRSASCGSLALCHEKLLEGGFVGGLHVALNLTVLSD